MSTLRHPIRAVRESLGSPGMIIAVVALIAALGGTAIASGGLSAAEKSLIKQEAKKWAKKFATAGPQGAPGANGTNGTNGKDGAEGKEGPAGADGEDGQTGFTETLPSGATETGSVSGVSISAEIGVHTEVPISFSIPLAAALDKDHVFVIYESAAVPSACENAGHAGAASGDNPEASSGFLCVYLVSDSSESTSHTVQVTGVNSTAKGASTAGANLVLAGGEAGWPFQGTWAVTG